MLSEKTKALFGKLMLDYPPVALKFTEKEPENVQKSDKQMSFCRHIIEARFGSGRFYIDKDNDTCFAKIVLGMAPKPPEDIAGKMAVDYEIFSSPEIAAEHYGKIPVVTDRVINYVTFSRLDLCDFDPDLLLIFCDVKNAEILLRAACYNTGVFWESHSSPIMSCAWTLSYPLLSGKLNYISGSIPADISRNRSFPPGLIFSIPSERLKEIIQALEAMPWKTIAFRTDKKSVEEFKRRSDYWVEAGKNINLKYVPHERVKK